MENTSLIGLIPLIVYIVFCFLPFGQIFAVMAGIVCAAAIGGHGLMEVASAIRAGLGSFLGYIGLIILLGGGLGMVLKRTGVVHYMVTAVTGKLKVDSQKKAFFVVMLTSVVIVSLLGTMAGGNAIIAPILIPIAASMGVVPNAMAVLLHGAGATGLFLGPFTPPVVALTEFTGINYVQFLLNAGLPISVIMWIVTFFWAGRVQKKYQGKTSYTDAIETEADKAMASNPKAGRAAAVFFVSMISLVAYGIVKGGG
ncbi:MAG: Na+/H+ antiporter NhaC family protein, partial [Pyramidobacter sp.]|nr:Na+/H+ antiporter NhaC family protein [Pyramidobacter sp.]